MKSIISYLKSPLFYPFLFLLRKAQIRLKIILFLAIGLVLSLQAVGLATSNSLDNNIRLLNRSIGVSTLYIGACEGNVNFNLTDLTDLGLNTYRLYGGMSRWEKDDDDGVYGFPSISQIKADPDIIPWNQWDKVMTSPSNNSDYAFSGTAAEIWKGNARTIFESLKQAKIRPVVTIRNSDPGWSPDWALQLNPPRTEADWNEWWEHVFATVYWLNVRNDYQVDDWEIHNEPDNRQQGWGGNQDDYFELVKVGADAIAYVYRTYLPNRQFHIHAPKTTGGSNWPAAAFDAIPSYFDSVNIHNYDSDISGYVRQVRQWMQSTVYRRSPLWLGEWGTYKGGYDDLTFSLELIKNLIRASQPGDTYVYGSHIFSLYDWGRTGTFEGLIDSDGDRRLSYYAMRMAIRALQGGRPVLLTTGSDSTMIATRGSQGKLNLLMVNSMPQDQTIYLDLSQILDSGLLEIREFSQKLHDEVVTTIPFSSGDKTIILPGSSARLIIASPQPD